MIDSTTDLTIIGGAAAGSILLAELSRCLLDNTSGVRYNIIVVDPNINPEGGIPHADPHSAFHVNMRTKLHDIAGQPSFVRYLRRSGSTANPPLRVDLGGYTRYIKHRAIDALEQQGHSVRFVRARATALEPSDGGYSVTLDRGEPLKTRSVVLATGNPPPSIPSNVRLVQGSAGRIRRYTGDSTFAVGIGRRDNVLVLGMGPGGVDVARYLIESGFEGTIHLASRGGRLSAVTSLREPDDSMRAQVERAKNSLETGREHSLDDLAKAFLPVFRTYDPAFRLDPLRHAPVDPAAWLEEQIVLAAGGRPSWMVVLEAVGRVAPELWRMLSPAAKREFFKTWKDVYYARRHTSPLATSRWLAAQLASGDVRVGRIPGIVEVDKRHVIAEVELTPGGCRRAQYHWLVLATGPEYHVSKTESGLIRRLLEAGLAKPCMAAGEEIGGLATYNLELDGLTNVFAMGALVRGEELAVHSFPALARHAESIVQTLRDRLGS